MTSTGKKTPRRVATNEPSTIQSRAPATLKPAKAEPSKVQKWLQRMPPVSEGMPTQREYGEWLPKFKAWMQEAESFV